MRALVHRSDWRSEQLDALGADPFVADIFDPSQMRDALAEVSRVYLNNQTGGAIAFLCKGYNGRCSCERIANGRGVIRDFGPINSVYLRAT